MNEAEVRKALNEKLNGIDEIKDPVKYTHDLTKFLSTMHPSDAYVIIRDNVVVSKNKRISACKNLDLGTYQEFQDLNMKCKRSHDHDMSLAKNIDVDKAVSKAYGIVLRMLRAFMDMEKERFDKITHAINRIEERLGLDVTDFGEDEDNDTTQLEHAQGIEDIASGSRETGEIR